MQLQNASRNIKVNNNSSKYEVLNATLTTHVLDMKKSEEISVGTYRREVIKQKEREQHKRRQRTHSREELIWHKE